MHEMIGRGINLGNLEMQWRKAMGNFSNFDGFNST